MSKIMKLKLALVFAGGVIAWLGYNEFRLSEHATESPQPVELAEIEAGRVPDNPHLEIGPHWRMYQELLFRYEASGEATDDTPIEYAYYPVLSAEHPYFRALDDAREEGIEQIANDFPTVQSFSVLVKTKQFKTVGSLPEGWGKGEPVSGLVVNRIYKLKKDEAELLALSFPGVDLDHVLVLQEGRTPTSRMLVFALLGGGAGTSLAGVAWLLLGIWRKPANEPEASDQAASPRESADPTDP